MAKPKRKAGARPRKGGVTAEEFGRLLRGVLDQTGIPVAELGRRIERRDSSLHRNLSGRFLPGYAVRRGIEGVLGLAPKYLDGDPQALAATDLSLIRARWQEEERARRRQKGRGERNGDEGAWEGETPGSGAPGSQGLPQPDTVADRGTVLQVMEQLCRQVDLLARLLGGSPCGERPSLPAPGAADPGRDALRAAGRATPPHGQPAVKPGHRRAG